MAISDPLLGLTFTQINWDSFWGAGDVRNLQQKLLWMASLIGLVAVCAPLCLFYSGHGQHRCARLQAPTFPASFSYASKSGWPRWVFAILNVLVTTLLASVATLRRAWPWLLCVLAMGVGNAGLCIWPVPPLSSKLTEEDVRSAEMHLNSVVVTFLGGIAPLAIFGFKMRGTLVLTSSVVGAIVAALSLRIKLQGGRVFRGKRSIPWAMVLDSSEHLDPVVRSACCLGEWLIITVAVLAAASPPSRPTHVV